MEEVWEEVNEVGRFLKLFDKHIDRGRFLDVEYWEVAL